MNKTENNTKIWLFYILLTGLFLRLFQLGKPSLFVDEAFALYIAKLAPLDICSVLIRYDQHPPLYYLFLHLWIPMGVSEFMLRLPSAIFSTIAIYLTFMLGKELSNEKTGLLAAFMTAMSPGMFYITLEAKSHSPGLILIMAVIYIYILLAKYPEKENKPLWILHTIILTTAFMTHYLTIMAIILETIFCITLRVSKTFLKRWIISIGCFIILITPWIFQMTKQVSNRITLHQSQPGIEMLIGLVTIWNVGFSFFLNKFSTVLFGVLILTFIIIGLVMIRNRKFCFKILISWLIIFPLILFLLSFTPFKLFYLKYLFLMTAGAYYILLSIAIITVYEKIPLATIGISISLLIIWLVSLYNWYFVPFYGKHDWKSAANYINIKSDSNDLIIVENAYSLFSLACYYNKGGALKGCNNLSELQKLLTCYNGKKIFFVETSTLNCDPQHLCRNWLINNYSPDEAYGIPNVDKDQIILIYKTNIRP